MQVTYGMCFQMHTFSSLSRTILHSTKIKLQHLLHSLTTFCLRCPHYWSQNRVLHTDDWNRVPRGCQTHNFSYCDINTTKSFSAITEQKQNKPPSTLAACSWAQHVWKPHTALATIEQEGRAYSSPSLSVSCHLPLPGLLRAKLIHRVEPLFKLFFPKEKLWQSKLQSSLIFLCLTSQTFIFYYLYVLVEKHCPTNFYISMYRITKNTGNTTSTQRYAACFT